MPRGLPLLSSACAIALALLGIGCMVVLYLNQFVNPLLFYNADALYLPSLYRDLVERGDSLAHWYLTPAPYYFPDWPLYFSLRWLIGDVYLALAAVMAVQALLLWGLAVKITRRYSTPACALATAALAILLVCHAAVHGGFPYSYVMLSAYHFGALLMLLVSLWLLLPALDGQRVRLRALAALGLLTTVTVLSDRLYLLQMVVPTLCTLWLMRRGLPDWRRLCAVLLVSALIGVLLYEVKLLVSHPVDTPFKLAPGQVGINLRELQSIWTTLHQQYAPLAWLCAMYYGLLLTLAPGTLFARGRWRLAGTPAAWLAMFNLAGTLAVLMVLALSEMVPTGRYLIAAAVLPLVLGPAILCAHMAARQVPQNDGSTSCMALMACALLLNWMMFKLVQNSGPVQREFYPESAACVDQVVQQYGLRHGIGGYWDARFYAFNTRRQPQVAAFDEHMQPKKWIATLSALRDSYDFALVSPSPDEPGKLKWADVMAISGMPLATVDCGAIRVMVYPPDGLRVAGAPYRKDI